MSPSDLALLPASPILVTATVSGTERPVFTATVPANRLPAVAARFDQSPRWATRAPAS